MKRTVLLPFLLMTFISIYGFAQINMAVACIGKWIVIRNDTGHKSPLQASTKRAHLKKSLEGAQFEFNEDHAASFHSMTVPQFSFSNATWKVSSDSSTIVIDAPANIPGKQDHHMSVKTLEKDGKTFFVVNEQIEIEVRRIVQ